MTTISLTLCRACTRRSGDDPETCTSFPDGIPDDIRVMGADHRVSRAGEPPFELDAGERHWYDAWLAFMSPTPQQQKPDEEAP